MSKVYYTKVEKKEDPSSVSKKTSILLKKVPFLDSISKNDLVGIKTHFGEKKNIGYIRPNVIKRLGDLLQQKSKRVFVTDTNTLYIGSRSNSTEHLRLAHTHGFDLSNIGIPVIIADGVTGRNFTALDIEGKHLKSVKIASDIASCDFLLCLSHMTGHMQTGFGAAIKNMGMGCASRAGKLEQHSNVLPEVVRTKCIGCGTCLKWCPANAINFEGGKASGPTGRRAGEAVIIQEKCIGCGECTVACKSGAIEIKWSESIRNLQEKMAEYASGVIKAVGRERICYINFLTHITKDCDCMARDEPVICEDIGIMASADPVALDKASVDIILKTNNKDVFKTGYPDIDWSPQLEHAEAIGVGSTRYTIEEVRA
ncbi:MAG: DUF362 domain-containing protein [Candidatus Omnitrophica bacterium]|nr:DUF362 domain-containing protein [Candidatus Omnitrophota bacterium]